MSRLSEPGHTGARTAAALAGSGPTALVIAIALTYALPCSFEVRVAVGVYSVMPLWIAIAWIAFLARNGRRAWVGLLATSAAALVVAVLGSALHRGAP